MVSHSTTPGLGFQQISTVAILLCFFVYMTSGFSIAQNKADVPDRSRVKREVTDSIHCKSNGRVNCEANAAGRKRTGLFPDWARELLNELFRLNYGTKRREAQRRLPKLNLSILEQMSQLRAKMSDWRLHKSISPELDLDHTTDIDTAADDDQLFGTRLSTRDFD